MKILTCVKPGQFEYGEAPVPAASPGNSIVKIKKIGVCGTDIHAFEGTQPYFSYPRILGHELGCEFVEGDADGFAKGDAVTIIPYNHCGKCVACRQNKTNCCQEMKVTGVHVDGGMAEYLSVPSPALIHGNGLSLDALCLVEPLSVSAHGVKRANVQAGEFVLVIGAGPIGLGAMEFAKIAGAQVIALDTNNLRLEFCKSSLKVKYALNAHNPHVMEQIRAITNGEMPTVLIDASGNQKAINNAFNYMAHTGRYVLIGLQKGTVSLSHPEFHKREGTLMSSRNAIREDFEYVIDRIRKGLATPEQFITHRLAFDRVKDEFETLFQSGKVIKALISFDE